MQLQNPKLKSNPHNRRENRYILKLLVFFTDVAVAMLVIFPSKSTHAIKDTKITFVSLRFFE